MSEHVHEEEMVRLVQTIDSKPVEVRYGGFRFDVSPINVQCADVCGTGCFE